jgi:hypothetical protein
MEKVVIEKMPNTKESQGAKRWEEEKGNFSEALTSLTITRSGIMDIGQ